MALPTGFIDLPVERGLDILKQLTPSVIINVLATHPTVYIKYRSFLPELSKSQETFVYVLVYRMGDVKFEGPEIPKDLIVVRNARYHSQHFDIIDVVGVYSTLRRAALAAISYMNDYYGDDMVEKINNPYILEELEYFGFSIFHITEDQLNTAEENCIIPMKGKV